jgi:drug/metabolite transporter (DMT)-like permease
VPALSPRNNMFGVLSAIAAAVFFSINDVSIKFLSGDYALHQVVLIRSLIGTVFLLAIIIPLEGGFKTLRTRHLGMHLIRGLFVVFANTTFFLGLAVLPLADAVAIFFVSPLIITVFSVIFLREYVGPHRWFAVVIGLIGVIVMMRPGSGGFQLAVLFPVAAAFGYASLHMLTRKLGGTESAGTMTFYIQVMFIAVSLGMGLVAGDGQFAGQGDPSLEFLLRGWTWPPLSDLPLFVLIGIGSALGGYFISQAYRLAEAGLAAPFEYISMPLAIFWGVVVFGEWPDRIAWIGISLIVFGGLYTVWREARHGRKLVSDQPTRR